MEWQNFNSGDVIFQEGEQSDAAYLIISGDVRIIQRYDTEEPKQLAVVGAGEYVGEMGAVDSQPRSASAIADGTVVCARVTPEEFMDLLRRNPDEAIDLLKILFERLRVASRRLAEYEQTNAN